MKKFLSLILFITLSLFAIHAEGDSKTLELPLKVKRVGNPHQLHRSPIHISIQAAFYPESNMIEITADEDLNGSVYLYHENNLIDFSDIISSTFALPYTTGNYTIHILSDSWEATGSLEL